MVKMRVTLVVALLLITVFALVGGTSPDRTAIVEGSENRTENQDLSAVLSPIWGVSISQWAAQISMEAKSNGLDPDFIAAVMHAESNGNPEAVSRAGAVGLMGVMPAGPGLEWRPTPEILLDPDINMSWGVAILAEIIRQSGGDLYAALAAYSGGWDQANSGVPQKYARKVLNTYGRAVAVRSGVSPDIASRWTIAFEITKGHIPVEKLILSEEPISGLRTYGEHVVFNSATKSGQSIYVKGYAVPLALVVPLENSPDQQSDVVDKQLMARLGVSGFKINRSNDRVLLTCLPSLSRLRGHLATRWYAPSECPSWHR